MNHQSDLVEQFFRAERNRTALIWGHVVCATAAFVAFTLFQTNGWLSGARGSAGLRRICEVGWPYLLAAMSVYPRVTSQLLSSLAYLGAMIVATGALCLYFELSSHASLGFWNVLGASCLLLVALFVAGVSLFSWPKWIRVAYDAVVADVSPPNKACMDSPRK
jgi:hypothetical protein